MMEAGAGRDWYGVILYLSLAVIWSFLSCGSYGSGNQLNYLDLRIVLFCKSGLIAIVYLGRYLLFREARIPGFFKWAAGFFLVIVLGIQFSINSFHGLNLLLILMDGLIFSIFLAHLAEIISSVFRFWRRLPEFEPYVSYQYWNRLWMETAKLGLLVTLLMILAYIYIVNFLLVDTVLYSYLLTVPVLGTGAGLFGLFFNKVRGRREAEIRAIDRELTPYIDWQRYKPDGGLDLKEQGVLAWVQYLRIIREYLRQMKRPLISWWVVIVYLLFGGVVLCLPYLFNVVVEV
jgi:hypothetical protein